MDLIREFKCQPLGRSKPEVLERSLTVAEHYINFYLLDTTDVWTTDGWLVTAIQGDSRTVHMRRGEDARVVRMGLNDPLYFTPDAKARRFLAQFPIGRNADGSSLGVDDGERATQPHGA